MDNNIKILIAEDNIYSQIVLKTMLKKMNYSNITIVTNGLDVLEKMDKYKYNILFLDIRMPIMDGYETLSKLCKKYEMDKLPYIIVVTANALDSERKHCILLGADEYIMKPYKMNIIEKSLKDFKLNNKFYKILSSLKHDDPKLELDSKYKNKEEWT